MSGYTYAPSSREGSSDPLGISAIFDRRLDANLTQPIAVAFSGGGDSLAVLIATKAWAEGAGGR